MTVHTITPSDATIIAGETTCVLMPERALFAPACGTLLIADMHLGKVEAFAAAGAPVPVAVEDELLHRVERAVERSGATRLVIVGDMLHAGIGITASLIERVASCIARSRVPWLLVPGNHDRAIARVARECAIEVCETTLDLDWAIARHEPATTPGRLTISGHLHPATHVGPRGFAVKLPAFWVLPNLIVLPAFTRFAAGGGPRPRAAEAFVIADDRVERVPTNCRYTPVTQPRAANADILQVDRARRV